jgi:hypothetical protein
MDRSVSTHEMPWDELQARIANPPTYPSKDACPLIKLAVFGNAPSDKGYLRHDTNVLCVTGIAGDYDTGTVSIHEAAERLRRAGILCMVVTTASNKPGVSRWRVYVPLSVEYPPEYHRAFVAFLDAALGNILARESFVLSQSYYVGRVDGVPFDAIPVDGEFLDKLMEPSAAPIETAPKPQVPEWRHVDLNALPLDDTAKALIRDGAPQGERSEALLSAANSLARARVHPDDILRVLSDPANGISAKALAGRRQTAAMEWLSKHTVRKALQAFPPLDLTLLPPPMFGDPANRDQLLVSASYMAALSGEPDWLVENYLEANILGVVFGQPGAGKSFVAMDWAACIAAGVPWNGNTAKRGAVCYIAGEGHRGIGRRMKAWAKHRGVPIPPNLHFTRRAVPFNDPTAFGELDGAIAAMPESPVLIVVDTLARATPGLDLDKGKDMGGFVRTCDRLREKYGCAVLVLHHSGHGDKTRAMNSIALLGAVDFEAGVIREARDLLRLTSTKTKDADPFDDLYLRFETIDLEPVGSDPNIPPKPQSSVVLIPSDKPGASAAKPSAHWTLLREIINTNGGPIGGEAARDTFVRLHGGKGATARRAFYTALERAIDGGSVVRDEVTGMLSERLSNTDQS